MSSDFPAPQRIGLRTITALEESIVHLEILIDSCKDPNDRLCVLLAAAVDWYTDNIAGGDIATEDEAETYYRLGPADHLATLAAMRTGVAQKPKPKRSPR